MNEKAVDIAKNNTGVGVNEFVNHGRQLVVVTKFDFRKGNGVIFIDDGNNVAFEEMTNGLGGVVTAFDMAKILMREQNLRDGDFVPRKRTFIICHQKILADGGACLKI